MMADYAETDDEETQSEVSTAEAKDAASRAVERDRLLDGEDPTSTHPDDIAHWISAYSELIAYKESLIAKTHEEASTMTNPAAQNETEEVDLTILRRELDNFQRRLEFWQRRRDELGG